MLRLAVSIPTYNRADILADRLARMSRMQRRIALEISISDNASADHTREVVESFRNSFAALSYVRQPRLVSPTINFFAALRNTTFPYVTQIGDDDTIFEDGILQALEMLEAERKLQAVAGNYLHYDFANDKPIKVTEFIRIPEHCTLAQFDAAFERFYFFEYLVMRRTGIDAEYYNEGLSYPTGWKLFLANLSHGPIRLETIPLICKGASADQWGFRNYFIGFQDATRADPEWCAARRIPQLSTAIRKPLVHAALMRTVRYSSDSTVNANMQQEYLIGLHHAQKAAVYDYDTKDYPKFAEGELIFGRLCEWLVAILSAAPHIARVVCENHPVCTELQYRLGARLAHIREYDVLPLERLQMGDSEWVITYEYQPHLAQAALQSATMTYIAVMDVLRNSTDTPQQFKRLMSAGDDSSAAGGPGASELAWLASEMAGARLPIVPAERTGGSAIASGEDAGSPEQVFDDNPETFWTSAERGTEVKDRAWIGYAFAEPHTIRRIRVEQTTNPGFRQDLVRVEKSLDGGVSWVAAAPGPVRLRGTATWVDLSDGEPARLWRLVAAGDNATAENEAWTVTGLAFFVLVSAVSPLPVAMADLAGGSTIASGDGSGSPHHVFDGNSETFWISAERGTQVKDRAWIGYAFAEPQAIGRIRVDQTTNPGFRQDLVRVEKSLDGGVTWAAAAGGAFRLRGATDWIDLPASEPARLWRLVAAGDNASAVDEAWTVTGLAFFVLNSLARPAPLVPADLSGGSAIASGDGAGSPEHAFDGNPETFWISAERGTAVKDGAWIGYAFAQSQPIRRIRVDQTANPGFRQDLVRVEKSGGGEGWVAAAPGPFRLSGATDWIYLPESEPARFWRLVAAGDNATSSEHAWSPLGITFFVAESQGLPADRAQ